MTTTVSGDSFAAPRRLPITKRPAGMTANFILAPPVKASSFGGTAALAACWSFPAASAVKGQPSRRSGCAARAGAGAGGSNATTGASGSGSSSLSSMPANSFWCFARRSTSSWLGGWWLSRQLAGYGTLKSIQV